MTMKAPQRGTVTLVLSWVILASGVTAPVAAADPLHNLPFEGPGGEALWLEMRNDGRQGPRGSWELEGGRLEAGLIRLRLSIQPPAHGLPIHSGPATLFGRLSLFGDAGGDIGLSETVEGLATASVTRCDDGACRYTAEIALPTADLLAAINRLEEHGTLTSVRAELTLVRTFGGGTWLQVLPFLDGGAAPGSRLGAIKPASGTLFPFGLFPADEATPIAEELVRAGVDMDYAEVVEAARLAVDDPTEPLRTGPARLRVAFDHSCDASYRLTMHDDAGDRVFDVPVFGLPSIDDTIDLPTDVRWRLTLHDTGGIDFDQRSGWGIRIGDIATDGTPTVVDARFDCAEVRGAVSVTGGGVEPDPSGVVEIPILPSQPPTPQPSSATNVMPSPLGSSPLGALVIAVVAGLVLLLGIGGRRQGSGP
jgi:hypothetical protein